VNAYEPGAKNVQLEAMFEELKKGIMPLVRSVAKRGREGEDRAASLYGEFDEASRRSLAEQ
jgi:Zn-dependent M32 family carboxypeptidase